MNNSRHLELLRQAGVKDAGYACLVCDAVALESISAYRQLPRVTSDCRPWSNGGELSVCAACGAIQKRPTNQWQDEIQRVYAGYKMYYQSNGVEQPIFAADGSSSPRSRLLIDFLLSHGVDRNSGKLLDVGCGNGSALRSFASVIPGWKLYGSEREGQALPALEDLENFGGFFGDSLTAIEERFDLVTLIHVLEHLTNPRRALAEASTLLGKSGRIFVQVPNVAKSPFDIVIVDHLMHFTPAHLQAVAAKAGLNAVIQDDFLPKELSMVATPGRSISPAYDPAAGIALANGWVSWLEDVVATADDAANKARAAGRPFGIFGTSNSGTWISTPLHDRIDFFIDEDVARIGRMHEGRRIVTAADAPPDAIVFVPLAPEIAAHVIARLDRPGLSFVPPPNLPRASRPAQRP